MYLAYRLRFSDPIPHVGIKEALGQINIDTEKMKKRSAIYDW